MKLEPLYRFRMKYTEGWGAEHIGGSDTQLHQLFDGHCEGRINGRFRGTNNARARADGTFLPNAQGVIETDDGAAILYDMQGYGRAYPTGRRQVVVSVLHLCHEERYQWLNDTVCVGVGEVRSVDGDVEIVVDMAELIWEPIRG